MPSSYLFKISLSFLLISLSFASTGGGSFKAGGATGADPTSAGVQDAASFVTTHLLSTANGVYDVKLHRIVDVTKQVVAGVLYKLTVDYRLSSCGERNQMLKDCHDVDVTAETVTCDAEVWDQQWRTPRHMMISWKCSPSEDNKLYYKKNNKTPKVMSSHDAFEDFKLKHNKQYATVEEETKRLSIFKENMKTVEFLQEHELGTATYGATQFADLSSDEFRKHYLTPFWNKRQDPRLTVAQIPKVTLPNEYDWRHYNAVTPVKNQGSCGSCWAFSVTGNIEGQWAVQKKKLISLSEQELVDCDKLDEGCNGGLPSNAYQEIQRLGGLEGETDYPYKGEDEKCNLQKQDIRVYINGSLNISSNETEMAAWLSQNGPLSIGINAFAMQFYFGGVSHPWRIFCSPDFLDHGVLIVGYAVKKGIFEDTPYWIVKNSWGTWWGEDGYYYVYRGDGTCGLNTMVSSAIIK